MIRDRLKQLDFGLLLISFAVAIGLWLSVKNERTEIRHFYPFIELRNQPANLVVKSQYPKTLDLVIQGQTTVLNGIQPDLVNAFADIDALHAGRNIFRLTVEKNVVLPKVLLGKIEAVQILPETLEIEAEPIKSTVDSSK
jgi:hypothetical protein